ncbi:uncharacterized protein LOC143922473 [Arctopsyche grandis]|uniref:uncharacterized protein LOC143920291 n=4 Tax=Arctopsyche grandis TaxID=121162 RepID=UPI00406D7299
MTRSRTSLKAKPVTSVTSRQRTRHTTMMISTTTPVATTTREIPQFNFRDLEVGFGLPKYNGRNSPIAVWIERLEENAQILGWTETQQLVYGRMLCEGTAKDFLDSETGIVTWAILKERLTREFGHQLNSADVHRELRLEKKGKAEDILSYIYRMKGIAAKCSFIEEEAIIAYIIGGLGFDKYEKMTLSGAGTIQELKTRVTQCEKIREDDEPRVAGPVRNRERERPQCYNCGGRGHLSADCRFKKRGTRCFNCNEFGHISAQCNSTKTKTVLTIQEEIRKEVSIPGAALLGSPITESVLMCIDGSKVKCVKKPCVLMEVNLERSLPRRKKEQDMRDRKEVWQQACKRPLQQRASREMSAQRELIVSNDEEDDANMADGGVNLADVSVNSDGLHRKRPLQQRASREMSAQRELIVSNDEEDDANMADGGVNLADGSMDGDGLQRRRLWDYGDIPFSNTDEPPDDQFGKGSKDYSHLKNSEDENKEKEKHKDKEKDMAKSQEGLRDPVKISTPKDTVFTFKLSRSRIDVNSMEKKIEPWIEKRLTGCISELEPICVDFIYGKLLAEYLWGDGRFLGQSQRIAEGIG